MVSHHANLSKMCKHWGSFLTHSMYECHMMWIWRTEWKASLNQGFLGESRPNFGLVSVIRQMVLLFLSRKGFAVQGTPEWQFWNFPQFLLHFMDCKFANGCLMKLHQVNLHPMVIRWEKVSYRDMICAKPHFVLSLGGRPARRMSHCSFDKRVMWPWFELMQSMTIGCSISHSQKLVATIMVFTWTEYAGFRECISPIILVQLDGQVKPFRAAVDFLQCFSPRIQATGHVGAIHEDKFVLQFLNGRLCIWLTWGLATSYYDQKSWLTWVDWGCMRTRRGRLCGTHQGLGLWEFVGWDAHLQSSRKWVSIIHECEWIVADSLILIIVGIALVDVWCISSMVFNYELMVGFNNNTNG